jgi:hypothetical protein
VHQSPKLRNLSHPRLKSRLAQADTPAMESFALTLFVLCTCTGLICVALMARWLRVQAANTPDIELDAADTPAGIVTPLAPSPGVQPVPALASTPKTGAPRSSTLAASGLPEDDATQPMTRTDIVWNSPDWPTTVLSGPAEDSEHVDIGGDDVEDTAFADTEPMPVETATA